MRQPLALASSILASAALADVRAQAMPVVDPAPYRWIAADRETGFPFGHPERRSLHYLEVHDGLRGPPRTIRAIALRRSPLDSQRVPAFTAELSMRMSTATTTAATLAPAFAANHGPDLAEVLPQRLVSFPASAGAVGSPAVPEYPLPCDRPFGFAGNGPLCFELTQVDHGNRVPTRFDLYQAGVGSTAALGAGCGGLVLGSRVDPDRVLLQAAGAPPQMPLSFLFGMSFDQSGGLPLPLDLTPIGATGCVLWLAPWFATSGMSDASGRCELAVPTAGLAPGIWFGAQALVASPGVNPLGLVTSNAAIALPEAARVAGRLWSEDPGAATGRLQPVFGLVIEVR